jgi:hypothetical protein
MEFEMARISLASAAHSAQLAISDRASSLSLGYASFAA